jgi:DMSO/TMAO reductase YedYZ molybdopterin-dependent catalytic subunit
MTIGRSIPRYGRIEVGQRVRFERVMPAPTPERATLGRGVETVTVRTAHLVEEIRPCDSGVLVTLRHADGAGQLRACFNCYGQQWGGFGGLDVLADAPYQRNLLGAAA